MKKTYATDEPMDTVKEAKRIREWLTDYFYEDKSPLMKAMDKLIIAMGGRT